MKNSCVKRSGKGVQQEHFGRLAVATGAARLLVVRLERARHRVMHDEAHVRLVDAHAERVGRDDRAHALVHERVLHLVAVRVVEPGVIRRGRRSARARSTPVMRSTCRRVDA